MDYKLYKQALENLNLVVVIDQTGLIISANDHFCSLTGYTAGQLAGQHCRLLDTDHQPALSRTLTNTTSAWRGEISLKTKDNGPCWIDAYMQPLQDAGRASGFFCSATDITRTKALATELQKSQERHHFIAQATHDALYDWDMLRDNLQWYSTFFDTFGYQPQETESTLTWWARNLHPEDQEKTVVNLQDAIARKESTWRMEYRFRCRDGQYKYVYERGYILYQADGTPYRMLGSIQDIQALKVHELMALEQNRKLQAIAFTQSHLVRRPVANILGLLSCIDPSELSMEQQEIFNYLEITARELDEIIRQVIDRTNAAEYPANDSATAGK